MEGSRNFLFEYSLNIAAERSLNIPFERSWNVPQEYSENIALERSKIPDIFLVLGTYRWNLPKIPRERSGKVLCYGGRVELNTLFLITPVSYVQIRSLYAVTLGIAQRR